MTQIAILAAVIVIGIYFILKQYFEQKLKEEKFEFTKKIHEKNEEVQMYKIASTITPEKLTVLVNRIQILESENIKLSEGYKSAIKTIEKNKNEVKQSKKILQAIENEKQNLKKKSNSHRSSDSDSRSSKNDNSDSTLEQLAILALVSDISSNDSSSSSDWSGSGGDSSGAGSSDSYDSSSSSSDSGSSSD